MARDPVMPNPDDRKKIMFWESPKRQADLRVRLQLDGFTQSHFFRAIITGYLDKNEHIMEYIDEYKEKYTTQGHAKRKQIRIGLREGSQTKKQFALNENEVEDIFDIIAQEFPEL